MLVMTTKKRKHSKTREILDSPNLTKLEEFCDDKPRMYPKLPKALMELRQFVGANDIKETIAKSIQYIIAHQWANDLNAVPHGSVANLPNL